MILITLRKLLCARLGKMTLFTLKKKERPQNLLSVIIIT
jgi:hypothetical protein